MATVRAHWGIENALHWQLDVSFREDAARNRKDNGSTNIAILRRRALDLARRDTSKGSLSIKLKRLRIPTHPAGRSDKIRSAIPEYPAT